MSLKLLPIIIIVSLLFLIIPSNFLRAWDVMDDYFFENTEPEIILKPGSIKLYWAAHTYAPFDYQGRKLPTYGSKVTVNVQLEILGENPKNLNYSWFLDEVFQGSKSGYGKDSFEFWVTRFSGSSHTVLAKAFNESRSLLVEKSVTIPITSPDLVIYSKESSQNRINLPYTISNKDFEVFSDKETTFLALPYFFNIKTLRDLKFNWTFADKTYEHFSLLANIFGVKITNKKVGGFLEETLKVIATNMRQLDQKVTKTIKLTIY